VEDIIWFAAKESLLVESRSGKIKENVDMPDPRSPTSAPNWEPAAPILAGRCAITSV